MTEEEPLLVDCAPHGKRTAAVICRHMLKSDSLPVGVIENSSDPDDLQAWCFACEEKFQEEDGMTEVFLEFNRFAVVCVDCYAEAKLRHMIELH